jgi:hypothetical protein
VSRSAPPNGNQERQPETAMETVAGNGKKQGEQNFFNKSHGDNVLCR